VDTSGHDLRREDIEAVFRELLGRDATAGDIATWMKNGSLRAFLDGVLGSDEYKARAAERERTREARAPGHFLNCWLEGWERFTRHVGQVSPDGVAIVGGAGHLFIHGGSNDNVASYRGEVELPPGWLESWRTLMAKRLEHSQRSGVRIAYLVVPEKLAVYADCYPHDLTALTPRPILRLLDQGKLRLAYPLEALREARAGGETYLRTDSHLTPRGNRILAEATLAELGVSPSLLPEVEETVPAHLVAGDLGLHFDPAVLEFMSPMVGASRATIISDNREEVAGVGGHIGTIRVYRRDDAPDRRTVVVFGDSYGFGDDAYQGLSWWLAQVFREVHFVWVPCGWDPEYLDRVGAELVVCQTAERFITRVPKLKVNVRSLARETIARHQAIDEERVFRERNPRTEVLRRVAPAALRSAPLAERFPPPARPWTPEYTALHTAFLEAVLDDSELVRRFSGRRRLPSGYGVGLDERVVEYPWLIARLGGRVLDAGSVLNHPHILDRVLPRVDSLTIVTLQPEPQSFPERGVDYRFADLRTLPFEDGAFDTVVCLSTLEHVGMDNSVYGTDEPRADDPQREARRALEELERVLARGGKLLLSVPFGQREDHGWLRQFDAADLSDLLSASRLRVGRPEIFKYSREGWRRSSPKSASSCRYRDYHHDTAPVADLAAAARAVACVAIDGRRA
jgi:alginate O-acetyltransferase complex protein AlgJ